MLDLNTIDEYPFLDPERPAPPIYTFNFTDALGSTLKLFTTNLWLITKIVFVVITPFEIFRVMSVPNLDDEWQLRATTFVLGAVCKLLIAPALIYALMKVMHTGKAPGVSEAYGWGLTRLPRLVICAAIAGALQAFGYMFLIIPGIMIGMALELVYPAAVLEKGSPADILRRSSELTKYRRLEIFGLVIVLWVLTQIITVPLQVFMDSAAVVPISIFAAVVKDLVEQAATVLSLVIYLSLVQKCIQPRSPVPIQPASSF